MTYTRPNWGGPNSDIDTHIEEHLGIVDSNFMYTSKLLPYVNMRNLSGTNTARIERFGDVQVQGRKATEALNTTPVRNDKTNLVVDTVLYTRHFVDHFDEWTSSIDVRSEMSKVDGIALAKMFDEACLIQAQKSADFVAPAHLEDAFYDGINIPVDLSALTTGPEKAEALVLAHRASIEELIERDLGDQVYSEGISFLTPQVFSLLLQHDKLMNVDFGAGGANDFVRGRIGILNGIRVMETPRLPKAAVSGHPLGSAFDLSAAQARRNIVTIIPSLTLYAAQVHALDAKFYEWEIDFGWYLDTFQSYNIGQRRPDSAACVDITF